MLRILISCLALSCWRLKWGEIIILLGLLRVILLVSRFDSINITKVRNLFELDSIGFCLVFLRVWIRVLCIIAMIYLSLEGNADFLALVVVLLLALILSFSLKDYLLFYVRFEMSLVPIFFIVIGWGYNPERVRAGVYILFYTLFGSLPFLFLLALNKYNNGILVIHNYTSVRIDSWGYFFFFFAFLIKFPIYIVHLWLPKAHLEAPVGGSIMLAGVLLKLGGYGCVRCLELVKYINLFRLLVISLSVWGGFVVSLYCIRQLDIKLLIAYSSVVHIRGCISGFFVCREWGYNGGIILMVGHGLCSSGLFFLVGLLYERTFRRSILVNKGLLSLIPSLCLWWFLLLGCNMAAPPSINLLGEIILLVRLLTWSTWTIVGWSLIAFFSIVYCIYLFSLRQHGSSINNIVHLDNIKVLDYLCLMIHWAPINIVILIRSLIIFLNLVNN